MSFSCKNLVFRLPWIKELHIWCNERSLNWLPEPDWYQKSESVIGTSCLKLKKTNQDLTLRPFNKRTFTSSLQNVDFVSGYRWNFVLSFEIKNLFEIKKIIWNVGLHVYDLKLSLSLINTAILKPSLERKHDSYSDEYNLLYL